MKLKPYEFEEQRWPPPREKQNTDSYLFGFDEDYQPYIVRWETHKGSQGWCACTLGDSETNSNVSARPMYFSGNEVHRLIQFWSEAPALKRLVDKFSGKRKYHSSYCNTCGSRGG